VEDPDAKAHSYVWSWFALHAGQRLQLVNFWLIAVAFLASSYVQARANHLTVVSLGVSVTGVIASLAFWRLDVRTQQLIRVAEDALEHLERSYEAKGSDRVTQLMRVAAEMSRSRVDSYKVIIRGLQLSVAVLFALAAVYSILSL
jgi:ABC-type anion transport system duplicated permease subunit